MPRSARLDVLGVVHPVIARGIEGREIFRDDRDRGEFVRRLVGRKRSWGRRGSDASPEPRRSSAGVPIGRPGSPSPI